MKAMMAAILGAASILALTASSASAEIACNREGECWHIKERHAFRREHGVTVHPDNWSWGRSKYRWREHEGRGYWRKGVWVEF